MNCGEESAAEALCRGVGVDMGQPVTAITVARRVLGAGSVRVAPPGALRSEATLARIRSEYRIYLRHDLTPMQRNFAIAHELGHWYLEETELTERAERRCDAFAAALIAPREAFARAVQRTDKYTRIARWFVCSESCAALRYGEVIGTPLALVTPDSVRTRGEAYDWPDESKLREMATSPRLPGLTKATLRDDPRRVALRAS